MSEALLGVFVALCSAALVSLVVSPRRVFEFPWAISAVFAAFLGPQLLALGNYPWRLPPGSFNPLIVMTILCLLGCWAGYAVPPSRNLARALQVPLDDRKLFLGSLFLMSVGTVCTFLADDAGSAGAGNRDEYGNMTGAATLYNFFSLLQYPGFSIAFTCALRRPTVVTIGAAVYGLWIPLVAAVYFGRREPTVMTGLTIMLTLYFQRGVIPPRLLVVGAIVGAGIFIPITGAYRMHAQEKGIGAFDQFDAVEMFMTGFSNGQAPEASMAANIIHVTDESEEYALGFGYWNTLVFRFVPAQLIGRETKEGLMLPAPHVDLRRFHSRAIPPGSTTTGIGDSFLEFGYLGCLVFAAIGVVLRNLWVTATEFKCLPVQILYVPILTTSLRALTHKTHEFLPGVIYNVLLVGTVLLCAQVRSRRRARR